MKTLTDKETQIKLVAEFLLEEFGLKDYKIVLWKMKGHLGYCWPSKKLIKLSTYFIAIKPLDRMLNTVLHEIAHALTPFHGHDLIWKETARKIGAIPRARISDQMFEDEKKEIIYPLKNKL